MDFVAALGHGRSYGLTSRLLGRALPGITACALWREVARRPAARTAALITDVGNDILYGIRPEQTALWVDECCARLARMCETLVVTQLPLSALETLGRFRFYSLRTVLFPGSRLGFEEVLEKARRLNELVVDVARRYQAQVVEPDPDWYGLDPIHIRRCRAQEAWIRILATWSGATSAEPYRHARSLGWKLLRVRPHSRSIFGIAQRRTQPALELQDGTQISLY